jgi:hypothetical protein
LAEPRLQKAFVFERLQGILQAGGFLALNFIACRRATCDRKGQVQIQVEFGAVLFFGTKNMTNDLPETAGSTNASRGGDIGGNAASIIGPEGGAAFFNQWKKEVSELIKTALHTDIASLQTTLREDLKSEISPVLRRLDEVESRLSVVGTTMRALEQQSHRRVLADRSAPTTAIFSRQFREVSSTVDSSGVNGPTNQTFRR